MAGTLQHWRESASLILASKHVVSNFAKAKPKKKSNFGKLFPVPESKQKNMNDKTKEINKLNLLFVKRMLESEHGQNIYKFPGGMIDDNDFSKDWLEIFKFNENNHLLMDLFTYRKPGSPMFSRKRDQEFSLVPSEIALRVAAIRETFEESGVFLARRDKELYKKEIYQPGKPLVGSVFNDNISEGDLQVWRKKVGDSSAEFINMCRYFEAVPDIWSLYEWSNWLTPVLAQDVPRFDTAFFVSCIEERPVTDPLHGEIDHHIWMEPLPMLQAFQMGLTNMDPPHIYELCRIARVESAEDLMQLSCTRAKHRLNRWMPVFMPCRNGLMIILPGDSLYPHEVDLTGEENQYNYREETIEELNIKYPYHNRAFIDLEKQLSLLCNLPFLDSHILPMNFNNVDVSSP